MSISVKVSYNSSLYRFQLQRNPNFRSLCDALIKSLHLKLSLKTLSNPSRTPLTLWFLDDEGDYCRLFDDFSLQEALRSSPRLLRLRIRSASTSPEDIDIDNLPVVAPAAAEGPYPSTVPPQFSTSTLYKLLSYLKKSAPSHVQDELDTLHETLQRHKSDSQHIYDVRNDIASLFSNFLAKALGPSTRGKVSATDSDGLQKTLRELLRDASVSRATREAAVGAVRAVCNCRTCCNLIRERYAAILHDLARRKAGSVRGEQAGVAWEDEREEGKSVVRPVRYYLNQFVKLMRVAGPDTQDAYETFAVAKREAEERGSKIKVHRRLCKSIQRSSFHFLRNHVKEGRDFEIETRAVKCLGKSVLRKFQRQGYEHPVAEAAKDLAEFMAMDRQVLKLAFEWANSPDRPVTEPVDDDGDLPEFREEDQEWDDWHNVTSESTKKQKKRRPKQGRYKRSSSRREDWTEQSGSSSSESDRDRRSQRRSLHDRLHRRRGRRGEDRSYTSTSSNTIRTMNEAEWDEDRRWHRKGGKFGSMTSPMHSSEEHWRLEGNQNYESDSQESTGTNESQWARVQMEKERDMEAKRIRQTHLAVTRQMERERMMDAQLARERELEMEEIRRPDFRRRGSRMGSYGYRREDFPSHQAPIGPRRGSQRVQSPYHGPQGWRGPRTGSQVHPSFVDERMGHQIPNRNSRRHSFRSVGDRARDSFLVRDDLAVGNDQRRGSMPPGWDQPDTGAQDWGPM